MKSTHVVSIPIAGLPKEACEGHLFPALGDTSLISIGQLCDHGCVAMFDKTTVTVTLNDTPVLQGRRARETNGLWQVEVPDPVPPATANAAHHPINQSLTMKDIVAFIHAALFSPAISTLMRALQLNYIHIHGLTVESLKRHPPKSKAMIQGHLDQQRQNLASTKTDPASVPPLERSDPTGIDVTELDDIDEDYYPSAPTDGRRTHACFAAVVETTGKVFTDQTGRFPCPSSSGNNYLMIVYVYDANYIHMEPMPSRTKHQILEAYKRAHAVLLGAGLRPQFHRLDNEASDVLKRFMHDQDEEFQLAPPGIHRRNAAERAIRTAKNHLIAGISTTHPNFPLHEWDRLIPQAILTLNLLRGSRMNPKLSAWAQVHGHYDFNKNPIAPPGSHVLVHVKPDQRETWAPHAVDAWYLGPAMDSYRCYEVYTWKTRAKRISDTVTWVDSTVPIPKLDLESFITTCLGDITKALSARKPGEHPLRFSDSQTQQLRTFVSTLGLCDDTMRENTAHPPQHVPTLPPAEPTQVTAPAPPSKISTQVPPSTAPSLPEPTTPVPRVPVHHTSLGNTDNSPARDTRVDDAQTERTPAPNDLESKVVAPKQRKSVTFVETVTEDDDEDTITVDLPPTSQESSPAPPTNTPADTPWTKVQRRKKRKKKKVVAATEPTTTTPPPRRTTRPHKPNNKYRGEAHQATTNSTEPPTKGTFVGNPVAFAAAVQATAEAPSDPGAEYISTLPFCGKAVHPDTGELADYSALVQSSEGDLWEESACQEFGRLAQGYKDTKGTDTIFFIHKHEVPADRSVAYVRHTCTFRPQKEQQRRVRTVVGGDKVDYPGATSQRVADMTTAKLLINSTLSRKNARWMGADAKDFYLNTRLDRFEYARISVKMIPKEIMDLYDLWDKVVDGYIYFRIEKGMYGLPQAGRIAEEELVAHLAPYGYSPVKHTPGLWTHSERPVVFVLVVDDFGVQYVGKEHAEHLMSALKKKYPIVEDWKGERFCGIKLDWDYENRTCDLSLPGYIAAALKRFNHPAPTRKQDAPHRYNRPVYGQQGPQLALKEDTSERLDDAGVKRIQEIVGVLLFYSRAVDPTLAKPLNSLGSQQANATKQTAKDVTMMLNYVATHPDAVLRYHASDMILTVDSDASYLSETNARSTVGGYHFLSDHPDKKTEPRLNGAVLVVCNIMKNVMASAAEAETGGLFENCQAACPIRVTLEEMGWPQPATPVRTDNLVSKGIVTGTVKQRRSRALDMRFYWVRDRVNQGQFRIHWRPGKTNLADYFTKHHSATHHRTMRPVYLHEPNQNPSSDSLRGCVDPTSHPGFTEPHTKEDSGTKAGSRKQAECSSTDGSCTPAGVARSVAFSKHS